MSSPQVNYSLRQQGTSASSSEVLVIGGGPAGATAATLLAKEGVDVALFERAHFPRYHIGESIVPACLPILELLGLREIVDGYGFQRKEGTYFRWGGKLWDYRFGSLTGDYVYAWQVERSEFDDLLLRNAAASAVRVQQGRRVTAVECDPAGRPAAVTWEESHTGSSGRHEFEHLVDASGRAGIIANRHLSVRRFHDSFKNVAFWSYWKGGRLPTDAPAGATIVSSTDHGWVWVIPLRDDVSSVGVVMHQQRFRQRRQGEELTSLYRRLLGEADLVPDILRDAEMVEKLRFEQDYSYTSERFAGPGYFLVGDAACFLDPLLSTGVHLAMFSGLLAAACLASVRRGEITESTAERFHEESYRRTYLRLLVLVAAVYQQHRSPDSYFRQAQRLTVRDSEGSRAFDAFLNVVSGIEDIRDLHGQDLPDRLVGRASRLYVDVHETMQGRLAAPDLTGPEREQINATSAFWQSLVGTHTVTEATPVIGHHISTSPRLGVAVSRPAR
jgi:flavin-dependent dehydrogenase